jgi:glycosyltransferase involved in cell wall biosynthesis
MVAWARFERAILKQVQAVVVFTDRDRDMLAALAPHTQIMRISLGTTLPQHPLSAVGMPPLSILFVGNFVHPPNIEAAVRLAGKIFPHVRARHPDLMLYVVGDRPPLSLRRMANTHVVVTGRVPDVTPYLNHAAIVVVPLSLGGGMRVKVLEALAAGKAVVASPRAVEGLDLVDGEHVILAESDEQFCDAIKQLLAEPQQRVALGVCARAWACANLGWQQSIAAYENLYQRLLNGSA